MSDAPSRRADRLSRWKRKRLNELFEQGQVLAAASDAPGRLAARQIVSISRSADGRARVHVEHYEPGEWDRSLEEREHYFPDLVTALAWIEKECGVHWPQLHVPEAK